MTREEISSILNTLITVFPQSFRHLENNTQKTVLVDQWYENFSRYHYEDVHNAVNVYISGSNYAPTIAQIREKLNEERKYKKFAPVECDICGGIGGVIYYRYHTDAPIGWYKHMAVCTCEAGGRLLFRDRLAYNVTQLKNLLKHDDKFRLSMPLNQQQTPPEEMGESKIDVKKVMERLKVMVDVE